MLLNVSEIRSDALVLTPEKVVIQPLAMLTPQSLEDQVVALLSALDSVHHPRATLGEREQAEQRLSNVLGWLWEAVTGPVLDRLELTTTGSSTADRRSRLWWCPSGLLAFLPLHAAGDHRTRFDDVPKTVLDRVVSSYTPTLRALHHSRRPLGRPSTRAQLLVVAMSKTPNASDLPGSAEEVAVLQGLIPGGTLTLVDEQATYERVMAALPDARWAHFACHASSDLSSPSSNHLLLHDHERRPLTVTDLGKLHLGHSELAFLSACSTARTGPHLADEAIHLATGCQVAGYRHVIATLWPIGDRAAVQITKDVYASMTAGGARVAASALHSAIVRRRDLDDSRPSNWAAHTHTGS